MAVYKKLVTVLYVWMCGIISLINSFPKFDLLCRLKMRAKVWLLFTLAVLLFVESDSQYIRRRRKKVLPVQQNGHNRPRPVQEKQMSMF